MKVNVLNFENEAVGEVNLSEAVFGGAVRRDILTRMVNYQLAKRRAGTHKVKGRSEVARTGAKSVSQKGSGGARHHAKSANIFVGGGRAFGPTPRSYAFKLPKKVRALALKSALSSKMAEGNLVIVEQVESATGKTSDLSKKFQLMGLTSALIIAGDEVQTNFDLAARNIKNVDVLPAAGINVYDILRREKLVLSKEALEKIEERLQ